MSNGTLNIASALAVANGGPTLLLTGGTIDAAADVTVNSAFNASGGVLSGAGVFTTGATATSDITGFMELRDKTWNHAGALTMSGSSRITLGGTGAIATVFNNQAGGTFTDTSTDSFPISFSTTATNKTFANAGTFTKNAPAAATQDIDIAFSNTGTLDVNSGTLRLAFGGTHTGAFTPAAGTTVQFSGGTHTFNGGVSLTDTGTVQVSNGTLNIASALTVANGGPTLLLSGGTIDAAADVTVNSAFNASGGVLSGAGVFTTGATATSDITGFMELRDKTWNHAGALTMSGSSRITLGGTGATATVFNNQAGGTFTDTSTNAFPISFSSTATNKTFANAGTWNKNASATASREIDIAVTNTGTLNVNAGTLVLGSFPQNNGTVNVAGGATLSTNSNDLINPNGAVIGGAGTLNLGATRTLTNNGSLRPGEVDPANSIGTLTITGNLSSGANSQLLAEFRGAGDADVLSVSGNAALNGTLTLAPVGGYVPVNGQSFRIVQAAGVRTGLFTGATNTLGADVTAAYDGAAGNGLTLTIATGPLNWIGADGDWNVAGNWDRLRVPTAADSVTIDVPGTATVSVSANSAAGAVTTNENLAINGATLTLGGAGASTVNGTLGITNGALAGTGPVTVNGLVTLNGGTISNTGGVTATNGTTVNAAGSQITGTYTTNALNLAGANLTVPGTLTLTGTNPHTLGGGTLNVTGTLGWTGGDIDVTGIGAFTSTGNFNVTGTRTIRGPWTWNGGTIAGPGTLVTTGATTINGGAKNVTGTWNNQGTATWTAGSINLSGTITNEAGAIWNVGTAGPSDDLNGTGTFTNLGTVNANAPSGSNSINPGTVNHAGVFNLQSGDLDFDNTSTYNFSGTLNMANGTRIIGYVGPGSVLNFNPGAAINVTGGTARIEQNFWAMNVNGNVALPAGLILNQAAGRTLTVAGGSTLTLNGPTTFAGSVAGAGAVAVNGALTLAGASLSNTGGVTATGGTTANATTTNATTFTTNALNVTGGALTNTGTLTLNGAANHSIAGSLGNTGTLVLNDGDLAVSGAGAFTTSGTVTVNTDRTLSGPYTWSGGTINGPAVLTTSGTGTVSGGAKTLSSATWNNTGAVNWSGGRIDLANAAATIENRGTWNIQTTAQADDVAGLGTFNNHAGATINANAALAGGVRSNTINPRTFNHAGTINIAAGGDLDFGNSSTINLAGTINFANGSRIKSYNGPGSTLNVENGTSLVMAAGASGTIDLENVAVNVTTPLTVPGGLTLIQTGGTLNSASPLTFAANSAYTLGGTLQGNSAVTVNGAFNLPGGGSISNTGGVTVNSPTTVSGGTTAIASSLTTAAMTMTGGTLNNSGTLTFNGAGTKSVTGGTINNSGTMNVAGTSGVSVNGGALVNTGTLNVQSGTLQVAGGLNNPGTLDVQAGGTFAATGGSLTNTGTLKGTGTINAAVVNNGTLRPGSSPGTLIVNGDYTQGASGVLVAELGGLLQGTQYDLLQVSGIANLGGTLQAVPVNGFVPAAGQSFRVLTYSSRTSDFTAFNGPPGMLASAGSTFYQVGIPHVISSASQVIESGNVIPTEHERRMELPFTAIEQEPPGRQEICR